MNPIVGRWLRLTFGLLIWAALISAIVIGWDTAREALTKSALPLVAAVPLIGFGLMAAAQGWAVLQPTDIQGRAFRAFLAAQPAKYLPGGGAFQLIGQIGLTSSSRADRPRAGVIFGVHAIIQMGAAVIISPLILATPNDISGWVLAISVVAAATLPFLITRSVLEVALRLGLRLLRQEELTDTIPATRTLWKSLIWSIAPVILSGLAFALLAGQWTSPTDALTAVGVFATAWVVGFVVFPLPSGLGLREIVLVGLLPAIPSSDVIATSLLHRFSTLLAELFILLFVSSRVFVASRQS